MKSARCFLVALISSPIFCNNATAQQQAQPPVSKPWIPIAHKDIMWSRRQWIEIDANVKGNEAFLFSKNNPKVPSLADQLIAGVLSGDVIAYSANNDRFTDKLTSEQFSELVRSSGMKSFSKYQIKEDSLSVGPDGHLELRILGLAPIATVKDKKGKSAEEPLFWIYYPDNREFLAKSVVMQNGHQTNWDAILDGHQFKSRSVKVNPRYIRMDRDK